MNRARVLQAAERLICVDRDGIYGVAQDNFARIAKMWSAYLDQSIHPHDVGMMMALLKIARTKASPSHEDNYLDGAGYIALAAELYFQEAEDHAIEAVIAEVTRPQAPASPAGTPTKKP